MLKQPTKDQQENDKQRNRFFGYSFLVSGAIGAFSTIDTLFYLAKGLSFEQIAFYAILLNLTIFLCEIPLGVLADKIGTLNALIMGTAIRAISALFFILNIQGSFIIATILAAVGIAFISGADSAALMQLNKGKEKTEKLFSSLRLYNGIGAILGGAVGYMLFKQDIHYPWLFSFGLSTIGLGLLIQLRQSNKAKQQVMPESMQKAETKQKNSTKPPLVVLIKQLITKRFFWSRVFFACSAVAPLLLWQVLFNQYNGGVIIGYLILQTAGVLAGGTLRKITFLMDNRRALIMLLNLGVMLSLAIWNQHILLLTLLMFLHVFLHTMQGIFIFSRFQDNIQDETRATSLSISSAVESILVVVSYYFVGILMESGNVLFPFIISVLNGLVAIILFVYSDKKQE